MKKNTDFDSTLDEAIQSVFDELNSLSQEEFNNKIEQFEISNSDNRAKALLYACNYDCVNNEGNYEY